MNLPSLSDYSLVEKIGCGSYAVVYKAFKKLPKVPHVSAECKNLLISLLKHNPAERITFEQFFVHEFLDLDHAPTKESYEKAVELVEKAVKMDTEKNLKEAFHLYCEALKYFIPLLTNETDPKRKDALRLHVNDYIKRAEILKASSIDNSSEKDKSLSHENKGKASLAQKIVSANSGLTNVSHELRSLSKPTPGIMDALEIGGIAELYFSEGNYALALEKFQSCMGLLVPLLGKEPPGRRSDLLYKQVQIWMKQAESTKALLATKDIEDATQRTFDSFEQCAIQ